MAFQIKDLLRLKKTGGQDVSNLRIAGYNRTFIRQRSVSLLCSYDVANDAENQSATYASRAAATLLLRRAQMLQ